MNAKKSRIKKDKPGPFRDILDTARLLSSSEVPEKVIETVLTHLCERLGKRARCALLEGEDLKLRFWAGEHSCPIGGVKIRTNSIVWDVVRKDKPINLTDARQTNDYEHTLSEPIKVKSIVPSELRRSPEQTEEKFRGLDCRFREGGRPNFGRGFRIPASDRAAHQCHRR